MKFLAKLEKYKNQLLVTLCVSILSISHGCILGWNSPSILLLKSLHSPLATGPITVDESSWLGSIYPLGSIVGNTLYGLCANSFGRKTSVSLIALPQFIFWLLIIFGDNIYYLYIARLCSGLAGGGLFVVVPLFTTEISSKEIRGSLSSSFVFAINIGVLVGYTICGNLSYNLVPYVFVTLPVLYFCAIMLFPETPQHLYTDGKDSKSKESLRFYRNIDKNGTEIEEAFNEMKMNLSSSTSAKHEATKLSDLYSIDNRKGVFQAFILNFVYISCGGFVIINYVGIVFEQTGANLDPNISSIIFAVVQIISAYISIVLGNRLTRRTLLIISSSGASLGLLATGIFAELVKYNDDLKTFTWIPITSLCFSIFMLTIGIMTFTFTIIAEILHQKIKAIGMAFINVIANIICFGLLKIFPIMMHEFGLISVMGLCGGVCILNVFFCKFYLTETSTKYI